MLLGIGTPEGRFLVGRAEIHFRAADEGIGRAVGVAGHDARAGLFAFGNLVIHGDAEPRTALGTLARLPLQAGRPVQAVAVRAEKLDRLFGGGCWGAGFGAAGAAGGATDGGAAESLSAARPTSELPAGAGLAAISDGSGMRNRTPQRGHFAARPACSSGQ